MIQDGEQVESDLDPCVGLNSTQVFIKSGASVLALIADDTFLRVYCTLGLIFVVFVAVPLRNITIVLIKQQHRSKKRQGQKTRVILISQVWRRKQR